MDITGIWVGTTRLGEGYEGAEGRCIDFLLELRETKEGLTGRVIDFDILLVYKKPIPVTGFFEYETLSFTRNYPFMYCYNPVENNCLYWPDSRPYEASYNGGFDEEQIHFSGNWELSDNIKTYGTSIQGFQGYGDWAMRRPTAEEFEMFRTMAENAGVPFDFVLQDTGSGT